MPRKPEMPVDLQGQAKPGAPAPPDVITRAASDLSAVSAADLRALLEAITRDQAETAVGIDAASASPSILATDEELDARDETLKRLRRRSTRLEVAHEIVGARLGEAEVDEAENARAEHYRAAQALVAEADTWIREEYGAHAKAIADGLVRLGEIDALLAEVNADRPAGKPRLECEQFRALPETPDTTSFRSETYYIDEQGQERRPAGDDVIWQHVDGEYRFGTSQQYIRVYSRTREVPQTLPGRPLVAPRKLATAVHLPGVQYADADFWPRRSKAWRT